MDNIRAPQSPVQHIRVRDIRRISFLLHRSSPFPRGAIHLLLENEMMTVTFKWYTDLPSEYMLIVSMGGKPINGNPHPPSSFSFFTMYWEDD